MDILFIITFGHNENFDTLFQFLQFITLFITDFHLTINQPQVYILEMNSGEYEGIMNYFGKRNIHLKCNLHVRLNIATRKYYIPISLDIPTVCFCCKIEIIGQKY